MTITRRWYIPTFRLYCAVGERGRLYLASGLREPSYWQRLTANVRALAGASRVGEMSEIERSIRKANPELEGQACHYFKVQLGEDPECHFCWFCDNPECHLASQAWRQPCLLGLSDEEIARLLLAAMQLGNQHIQPQPEEPINGIVAERNGDGSLYLTRVP